MSVPISSFLMSVVILTGIHKGRLKRFADPLLFCRTPVGTICVVDVCTSHRFLDCARSDGFW